MIQSPILIVLILFTIVIIARWWHERFQETWIMRFLPTPLLCYVPPTLLTTLGILPFKSQVYEWIAAYVLPACLILILMTTDIGGLKRIGRLAFIAITGSIVAVLISGAITFFLFRETIGQETWKAAAVLSASWIGGTANQLAVKQALGFSDQLFTPLFIADITIVYIWMTFLMIISANQKKIDQMTHADPKVIEAIALHPKADTKHAAHKLTFRALITLLLISTSVGTLAVFVGGRIPEIGMAINRSTWVIITVTTFITLFIL